jgi:surface antigen
MKYRILTLASLAALATTTPATARTSIDGRGGDARAELPAYLQCVPYARQLTGIEIYGDAHTWWGQAQGRYRRGHVPVKGSVMAFRPHGNSRLGHVAAVSQIVDSRTILLSHANWSVPGEVERNVRAVDVSAQNDWSEVRVWHGPSGTLGTTHWPVAGFIYGDKAKGVARASQARMNAVSAPRSNDPIGDIIAASMR